MHAAPASTHIYLYDTKHAQHAEALLVAAFLAGMGGRPTYPGSASQSPNTPSQWHTAE